MDNDYWTKILGSITAIMIFIGGIFVNKQKKFADDLKEKHSEIEKNHAILKEEHTNFKLLVVSEFAKKDETNAAIARVHDRIEKSSETLGHKIDAIYDLLVKKA
jgi:hypothetical protein